MDTWNEAAAYEDYVGRWSRLTARSFLAWLDVGAGGRWLDVGCGTGALTETVLAVAQPESVLSVDASEHYIAFAQQAISDARVRFAVADARALPCADAVHDVAVSGLVLNFIPEPSAMVAEMVRAVRSEGVVAAYVWDYAGEMQLMRRFWDAAIAVDPRAVALDEGRRFPICHADALAALWRECGLVRVDVTAIDVPTEFRDFDDYWRPFLGGQGPAPGYCRSLDEKTREALSNRLRSTLPTTTDGRIQLVARAFAVRGERA